MFDAYPTYDPYRPLELRVPYLEGEDVFALQCALFELAEELETDGVYGPDTNRVLKVYQDAKGITPSRPVSGPVTQTAVVTDLIRDVTDIKWRRRQLKGQVLKESSNLLGNYSRIYQHQNGTTSYDAGVTQRNTRFTHPRVGFDPVVSVQALHDTTGLYYARYADTTKYKLYPSDQSPELRRRLLAIGSWNAPDWTNYLAGLPSDTIPTAAQRETLETYMLDASVYLRRM